MFSIRTGVVVALVASAMLTYVGPAAADAPGNDLRQAPIQVAVPQTVFGNTTDATLEDSEEGTGCAPSGIKNSLWYRISGVNGRVAITIEASGDLDAVVDVFERERSQSTTIDCAATNTSGLALVAWDASSSKEYLVRVAKKTNSTDDGFRLDLVHATPPAQAPGDPMRRNGKSDTVNWARNPSDAYWIRVRSGQAYRINLALPDDRNCVSATVFAPSGGAVRRLGCQNGYASITPGRGDGGRFVIIVRAESRTLGNQRYHLQAGLAGFDDHSPGRLWRGKSIRGSLSGNRLDAVDVYNWDLSQTSSVDIRVKSRDDFSVQLLTPTGRRVGGGAGSVSRRLGPGTYFVIVSAGGDQSGSYELIRKERAITTTRVTFDGSNNATIGEGASVSIAATVSAATGGRVELTLDRFDVASGWHFARVIKGSLSSGTFRTSFAPGGIGRWRVRASFLGTTSAAPSTSKRAHLRVQR